MKKSYVVYIVLSLLILIPLVVASVRYFMPVPNDISYQSEEYQTGDVNFLYDITLSDENGESKYKQAIMDQVYKMIDESEDFLVIDMFLFNDDYDHDSLDFPPLSQNLTDKIDRKSVV